MERKTKTVAKEDKVVKKSRRRKKNEARVLLKRCFKNPIFPFVPFEIWRDILIEGERDVIARISQTCWGFKELVDNLRELLLEYALKYRREDKIPIAKNLILRCAEIGNSRAMFHVGYAYWTVGGWGLKRDNKQGAEWFRKAAVCGDASGMTLFAKCLSSGEGVERSEEWSEFWAKKALSSNDSHAIGFCHLWGLYGSDYKEYKLAVENFKISSEQGDEFGQRMLAITMETGMRNQRDNEMAFYWYLKSAEQGLSSSQHRLACMLEQGRGCERNEELSKIWFKKAENQGFIIE